MGDETSISMQYDTWNEHRTERDGSTTTTETLPNLNTAPDLVFKRHAEHQHFPHDCGAASYECNTTLGRLASL